MNLHDKYRSMDLSSGTAFVRNFFSSIGERCMVSNGIAPDSRDIAFRSLLLVLVRKCYKIPPTAVGLVPTAVICEGALHELISSRMYVCNVHYSFPPDLSRLVSILLAAQFHRHSL